MIYLGNVKTRVDIVEGTAREVDKLVSRGTLDLVLPEVFLIVVTLVELLLLAVSCFLASVRYSRLRHCALG